MFLADLPYYSKVKSQFLGDVIVTHTGIDCGNYVYDDSGMIDVAASIDKAVACNRYNYMIGLDIHQVPISDRRLFDSYMIVGHLPTYRLNEDMSNRFYRTEQYMDIDAGSGHFGGTLGCYCVDTDMEYYV